MLLVIFTIIVIDKNININRLYILARVKIRFRLLEVKLKLPKDKLNFVFMILFIDNFYI